VTVDGADGISSLAFGDVKSEQTDVFYCLSVGWTVVRVSENIPPTLIPGGLEWTMEQANAMTSLLSGLSVTGCRCVVDIAVIWPAGLIVATLSCM
jgi:hypothetical protein